MTAQPITCIKDQRQGGTANTTPLPSVGFGQTLWQFAGIPSYGAPPTSFANPDNTTPGGLRQALPSTGKQQLTSLLAAFCAPGELVLYDRLMHMGGLSGNTASVQNLNGGSPATVSRSYTNAGNANDGNEILVEVFNQVGTTQTTIVANYVSSAGVAHTTPAIAFGGATRNATTRCFRLPLAPGDTGVTSVTSIQLAAPTGSAGDIAVVIAHRILELDMCGLHMPKVWSGVNDEFREIASAACLYFVHWASAAAATNTVAMHAALQLVDF